MDAKKKYLTEQITGASPEKLVQMLLDGAIRFCEEAKPHVEDKDPAKFADRIIRAQRVLAELMGCLDGEKSPETAAKMLSLYEYAYSNLVNALREKDLTKLEESQKVIRHVRDTWVMACDKAREEGSLPSQKKKEEVKQRPSLSIEA